MKRILHFGGVLLALGMLLASCNIGVGDGQVSGDSVRNTSNVEGIVLKVNKIDNSRTILPADWTADRAGSLTYVLLGQKTGESGYSKIATFSYPQLTGGTAVVNLELTTWNLKLIGYITESDYTTKPCLEKELLNQDFSTGKNTITFDLKPVDPTTTTATGSVNVSIAWLTDKPKRVELGIYDTTPDTETIVKNEGRGDAIDSLETPSKKLNKVSTTFSGTGDKHTLNFTAEDNIKAGIYKFAAVFYDAATGGNVIGYYIDWLYVDGGNLSKETINYGDKFSTTPDNPTWLAVETAFVPQEIPTKDTTVSGKYYAKFHWNDVSTNETGFELVITEEGNLTPYVLNPESLVGNPLLSDKWYKKVTADYDEFDDEHPNSLDAGSTWVVLKLDPGKKYTAKIRAINDFTPTFANATKPTDFCQNLNRTGDGQGRTYAPIVGTGKQFGMFSVNYNVNYELDESKVDKGNGDTTGTDLTNYVVGFNYHSEQQNLMTDKPLPEDAAHLVNDTQMFDHWQTTTETDGKKVPMYVIPALNIENLELEPVWKGSNVNVSVTFPSYANAKDVKIVADKNEDNMVTFKFNKETNASISVDAGASLGNPQFALTDSKGVAVTEGTMGKSGTTWTWTLTKAPQAGIYCLQITGTYKAGFDSDTNKDRVLTLCGNLYIEVQN